MDNQKTTDQSKQPETKVRYKTGIPEINHFAAGIDVGDGQYDVAVSNGQDGHELREYSTFTEDIVHLIEWLKSQSITTVALESTGVYWVNLYLELEKSGIEPYLVNAKHAKNVTGRKKDDTDAIWLQRLHSCGLLQKSFQPDNDVRILRTYVRQLDTLTHQSSQSVQHMQKSLELMNIKLHIVISDLLGKTGMDIVAAILSGVRDAKAFLQYKNPRIKASDEDIMKAMTGIWSDEHLFSLQLSYDHYTFLQNQIDQCEKKIQDTLIQHAAKVLDGDITDVIKLVEQAEPSESKKKRGNKEFGFPIRKLLQIIIGVDICSLSCVGELTALKLYSEIGGNVDSFNSSKHFAAWLNLAPNTKISGGKILNSRMQKKKNYAGQALRMATFNLPRQKTPLGDFARKSVARLGKKEGRLAAAHKMARIIYSMIKYQKEFDPNILNSQDKMTKERKIKRLEKELEKLKNAG